MPTVRELSDPYANFMLNPVPPETDGVCSVCLTFTRGYERCYACSHRQQALDSVLPISYSVHRGQLHEALRGYKAASPSAPRFALELAAVLWRFLRRHERCLATRIGVETFEIVTTVPSSSPRGTQSARCTGMVATLVGHTASRYERLLEPSGEELESRAVDPRRYSPTSGPAGGAVLLIDDTWTTGANIESAAAVLRQAGAGKIGAVVIGRHVHGDFEDNAARLKALPRFTWARCALEAA